jgi:hypothetical protein
VPDIPIYPAVVSVAVVVASAASYFAGVAFSTALVLVGSGAAIAWFTSYKRPASEQQATFVQKATRWYFARVVRLAVGSALIATATVLLLRLLK